MSYRSRSQKGSFYGDRRPEDRGQKESEDREKGAKEELGPSEKKPVEIGKEYRVRVIDRSARGEGVARVEGFIVFINGAKPGEEITIRITNVGARAATAVIVPDKSETTERTSE